MTTGKLAIHGGVPAVTSPIPDWPPRNPEIRHSVDAALSDGSWGQYHGRPLEELVRRMRDWLALPHVWLCASGTIAVELALRGCGVRAGQQVILAGYDFPGNFRAVESIGAKPVLIDVRPDGWTMDTSELSEALSSDASAVLASHLHGELLDIREIASACRAANVPLVEDACQVPGAVIGGRMAGTWGDAGVFSFGGSKLLTSGRGGAVVTARDDIFQRMKISAERGNDAYPLSALQAAALLPQLDLLESMNARRHENAVRLARALADHPGMKLLPIAATGDSAPSQDFPAYFKFPLLLAPGSDRETTIAALCAEGLPADAGFRGFLRRGNRARIIGTLPNSAAAAAGTIVLHHPLLLGDDQLIAQTIAAIRKVKEKRGQATFPEK